jgi:hypothetical protein
MKNLFLIALIAITNSALAAELIVLTGYVDKPLQYDFKNSAQSAYLYSKKSGDHITFAAGLSKDLSVYSEKKKTWDFIEDNDAKPLANFSRVKDLQKIIKNRLHNLKKGEPLKIFINDHGTMPSSESDPLSSGFFMSSGRMSHKQLQDVLKEVVPIDQKVILVGAHCYSGGIHNIAFNMPNVCSASATDFRTTAISVNFTKEYGATFWDNAHGHTLSQTQNLTSEMIRSNDYRSQLSSMAYVDHILKTGPYKHQLNFFDRIFLGKTVPPSTLWKFEDVVKCFPQSNNILMQSDLIQNSRAIVEKVFATDQLREILDTDIIPKEHLELLNPIIDQKYTLWKQNKKNNLQHFLALGEDYRNYADMIKYGKYPKTKKVVMSPTLTIYKQDKTKPRIPLDRYEKYQYMQEQRSLYKTARRYLSKYFGIYKITERIDRLNQFYKIATPAQKEKLLQLLKCEQSRL